MGEKKVPIMEIPGKQVKVTKLTCQSIDYLACFTVIFCAIPDDK